MNNSENKVYYMERDGAVKIPEKYDKMNYAEITAECARLLLTVGFVRNQSEIFVR